MSECSSFISSQFLSKRLFCSCSFSFHRAHKKDSSRSWCHFTELTSKGHLSFRTRLIFRQNFFSRVFLVDEGSWRFVFSQQLHQRRVSLSIPVDLHFNCCQKTYRVRFGNFQSRENVLKDIARFRRESCRHLCMAPQWLDIFRSENVRNHSSHVLGQFQGSSVYIGSEELSLRSFG